MEITRICPSFAVAPQVTPQDLEGLARQGFRSVVNARPDAEEPGQPPSAQIEAEARRLGLGYRHIPITPGQMTEAHARELATALGELEQPVLGFCRSGARAANLWKLAQDVCDLPGAAGAA